MHAAEKRTQLRSFYVFKRLPMEAACGAIGVPKTTGIRWKRQAAAQGDDWDDARAAMALGDENFKQLSRKLIEDYLVQHQATMDLLRNDQTLDAMQRATILAGIADSFNKTMSSFRRVAPALNRHDIALDVLQRLAAFAQQRFARHVPALMELLEPFGEELAKAYA